MAGFLSQNVVSRTRCLLPLGLTVVLVAAAVADEQYGTAPHNPKPTESQTSVKPRNTENEAFRKQITQKLRYAMASVGIDDTGVQDALLQYLRDEEQSKRAVRMSSRQLAQAMQRPENQDKIPALIASHKQEMDAYKGRRELAQKTLDEKIRFSTTPQLEASLILIGVLGEGPGPGLFGPAGPGGREGNAGRGLGNAPLDAMRPNFDHAASSAPLGTPLPAGFGAGRPPGIEAATGTVEPTGPTNSSLAEGSRSRVVPPGSSGGPRPRPLPSSLRGTTVGTVDRKGMDYVEILGEDGTLERYTPRWLGGAQGGFDAKIIQAIGTLGIGERVTVEWEYAERKRISSITPTPLVTPEKK